ncbi:MAG: NADH-quinone oxidoreductase subunit L [Candidatus Gastranaerophilales bacterium]|nr:NADH-quinone oxidoreductase subunit L [Candidatus Gastranaerophilales bacterium]
MEGTFINNIYTVILFPLWVFLLIILGRLLNVIQSRRVISLLTLASTLYGVIFAVVTFLYMLKTPDYVYENSYAFLRIENYTLNFGVFVDNLSVIMLLVVTTISFLVQLYSTNYMYKDRSFPRFFAYLNLFNFSMIGLVLSPNLFQNYVFWELVGVSSYLLIGFWYKKPSAADAAKKAFLMNRIGDFGLLAGTIAISYFIYRYSDEASLATVPFSNIGNIGDYLYSYTNDAVFVIICVLLLFGSFAKSAQFPLHTWLADAMEGPTPVSALIHSATMVAAGVYLIARLYPLYSLSDGVMNFIAIIGLITALICAYFAITQNDLKRILAYSTNSQLGLMFLALGAGAYTGGLFHLVTHAYFKSMLFLCSGIVIHSLAHQQDIRFMGGLRKYLPLTAACYLIACISISGLLFSGFCSKEMILSGLLKNNHYIFAVGFLIVALMTAFYMFRSYFVVFEGDFKGSNVPLKSPFLLNLSISILAVFTVFLGIFQKGFEHFIKFGNDIAQSENLLNPVFISVSIAVLGIFLAFVIYCKKNKIIKPKILYQLSYNRFYIDNFYDFLSKKIYYTISNICAFIDKYLVDGLVILAGLNTRALSWVFSKMQTGNFQSYLAYAVIFLAISFAVLMFAYTMIMQYAFLSGVS